MPSTHGTMLFSNSRYLVPIGPQFIVSCVLMLRKMEGPAMSKARTRLLSSSGWMELTLSLSWNALKYPTNNYSLGVSEIDIDLPNRIPIILIHSRLQCPSLSRPHRAETSIIRILGVQPQRLETTRMIPESSQFR